MNAQTNMFIVLLLALVCHRSAADYDTIVETSIGQVGGSIQTFKDDATKTYYQYLGIPYAEPVARFEVAQPKAAWPPHIHNGTMEGKVCPQAGGHLKYADSMDEHNCLVFTVSTPHNPHNVTSKLPVLVYFHGGFFLLGSSRVSYMDPEPLLHEHIIVVQIQYRLGTLGWITDGKHIPKNIGLKDAYTGLKCVSNVIAAFGGDPARITINGESAGSVIASHLWHSARAQGLFSKAILQSGTSLNQWAFQRNPAEAFKKILTNSRCGYTIVLSEKKQVDCLRNVSIEALNIASGELLIVNDMLLTKVVNGLVAAVVLEDACDPEAIVTDTPLQALTNGTIPVNAPVLVCTTSEEMLSFDFIIDVLRLKSGAELVPSGMNAANKNQVGKLIKQHYGKTELGWSLLDKSNLTRFASDLLFNNPYRKYIEVVQPRMPAGSFYCMYFNYASILGLHNKDGLSGHADDNNYSWREDAATNEDKLNITEMAYRKRREFSHLFANFVRDGHPTLNANPDLVTINWPAVSDLNNVECLDFTDTLAIVSNPKNEHFPFWKDLFATYGNAITF